MAKRTTREGEELPPTKRAKTADLRSTIMRDGIQSKVQVNQRALIDKMLARYAGNYSTFRELIQNADDAGAQNVKIEFFSSNSSSDSITSLSEIILSNDGRPFIDKDWERISKIAEGNPDEQTVGMFGVGFYSVFSFTEHPLIYSDGEWLAFHWQGDQLCTSRMTNETIQGNADYSDLARFTGSDTSFLFSIRDPNLSFSISNLCQFLQTAMYFSKSLRLIKLCLNDNEICTVGKNVNQEPQSIIIPGSMKQLKLPEDVLCSLLPSLKKQDAGDVANRLKITIEKLSAISMSINTSIMTNDKKQSKTEEFVVVESIYTPKATPEFTKQCYRILKKNIPPTTRVSLLFQPQGTSLTSGKIFVGISTHQRTGSLLHLSGHFYPTIERENIDFQDTYLGHWNSLLLFSLGSCARLFYKKCMKQKSFKFGGFNNPQELATVFCFGSSAPQELISQTFAAGFFTSCSDSPLIETNSGIKPSKQAYTCEPSILEFLGALKVPVPAAAYHNTKSTRNFFQNLEKRKLIQPLPLSVIQECLATAVFSTQQFVALMSWVLKKMSVLPESQKREYRALLNHATYYEDKVCKRKNFQKVKKFAAFSHLPVPLSVLSHQVAKNFSSQILKDELKLKEYTSENWISEFLRVTKGEDSFLVQYALHPSFSPCILSFLSSHIIPSKQLKQIITKLGELSCIPCKASPDDSASRFIMKKPLHAALSSCWIPSDKNRVFVAALEAIEDPNDDSGVLDLTGDSPPLPVDDEAIVIKNGVTKSFLKKLGVRVAPPASVILKQLTDGHNGKKGHLAVIESLYHQREDFRDDDWAKIRVAKFINCFSLCDPSIKSIEAPIHCILSIKHIKVQTPFTQELYDLWEQTIPKITSNSHCPLVSFVEPPSYEIVNFLNKYLHITAFPKPKELLNKHIQTQKNKENYFCAIRFLFGFFTVYKDLFKDDPTQKKSPIFMSDTGEFYGAEELCTEANKFRPVLHPTITAIAKEMKVELKKIGIKTQPPVKEILAMLENNPAGFITERNAKDIFESLYETQVTAADLKKFKTLAFVPTPQGIYQRACEVLVPSLNSDGDTSPTWPEIFAYIDYGAAANEFLISCGAKHTPTGKDFAQVFIKGTTCRKYFKSSKFKAKRYLDCLSELAKHIDALPKTIFSKLKKIDTLLAIDSSNKSWKLCTAADCNLIDNGAWEEILKPCCAPVGTNSLLIKLYTALKCRWLTAEVTEECEARGAITESKVTKWLQSVISERYLLFLHKKNGVPLEYLREDSKQILSRLQVKETKTITRTLVYHGKSYHINHSEEISMCTVSGNVLLLHKGSQINYFDIGLSLSQLITCSHSLVEERGTMIAQLLQTPLRSLSSRGWSIKRILGLSNETLDSMITTNEPNVIDLLSDDEGEILRSNIRIPDFFASQTQSVSLLDDVVKQSCSRTLKKLNSKSQKLFHSGTEAPDCSLDFNYELDQNLSSEYGIMIYRVADSLDIQMNDEWRNAYHSFVELLNKVGECIPNMKRNACKVFLDEDSNSIAFNYNRTLFFNLRYYYQVHVVSGCEEQQAASFWFITLCHELAHNKESAHNKEHEQIMESLISTYMANLFALYK